MKHSLCLDTFYNETTGKAFTVGMVFDLSSPDPLEVITSESNTESAYIPGEFYKRELPPILNLLESYGWEKLVETVDLIIVDGFYDLWDNKPGLGHRLHDWLIQEKGIDLEIMGVAKSKPKDGETFATKVIRGQHHTTNPLWTNGSNPSRDYGKLLYDLPGEYRLPDILTKLDRKTKGKE